MASNPVWISLKEAMPIAGKTSRQQFYMFVRRWNESHPNELILRLNGKVDEVTLKAAVQKEINRCTPTKQASAAISRYVTRGRAS